MSSALLICRDSVRTTCAWLSGPVVPTSSQMPGLSVWAPGCARAASAAGAAAAPAASVAAVGFWQV